MRVTREELLRRHCQPCARVHVLDGPTIQAHLAAVPHWELSPDGKRIRRHLRARDFLTALDFFRRIGEVAEAEDHHPDLHLVNYRDVTVELWTHAQGGVTENDFVLAARIDQLPVELKE